MNPQMVNLLIDATLETLLMVGVSGLAALFLGVPLGVALIVTDKGGLWQNLAVNRVLGAVINATRSVPFIILMVAIIPFTRFIAGTSIGTTAAIVPLAIAAIPFMARVAETAMREVDRGLITAAKAMGASPMQIIVKVLL
ncbi:MAG: methionine ABC transporter permease, partial [Advenella sp.]|nr:methionine ABC transporter permease [Advenella sp.]